MDSISSGARFVPAYWSELFRHIWRHRQWRHQRNWSWGQGFLERSRILGEGTSKSATSKSKESLPTSSGIEGSSSLGEGTSQICHFKEQGYAHYIIRSWGQSVFMRKLVKKYLEKTNHYMKFLNMIFNQNNKFHKCIFIQKLNYINRILDTLY